MAPPVARSVEGGVPVTRDVRQRRDDGFFLESGLPEEQEREQPPQLVDGYHEVRPAQHPRLGFVGVVGQVVAISQYAAAEGAAAERVAAGRAGTRGWHTESGPAATLLACVDELAIGASRVMAP